MLVRNLALGLSLAMVSLAQAGAVVNLVRTPDQATYAPGAVVKVEVFLQQVPTGDDHALRQMQFDLNASDPLLGLDLPITHKKGFLSTDDVHFWYFGSLSRCSGTPDSVLCGEKHFLVQNLASTINPGPGIISATFGIDNFNNSIRLGKDLTMQITLKGDSTAVKVGEMNVTMPSVPGSYTLDLLNAAEPNVDKGGQIRFGFGLAGTEAITRWSARGGQVTGGTFTFVVGGGVVRANLLSSDPSDQKSLWRTKKNVIELTFDADLSGVPATGDLLIQEMLAGAGNFAGDLSGSFTPLIVNDGGGNPRILRLTESDPGVLSHQKWYSVRNTGGWAAASNFEVQYVAMVGDADNNNLINFNDVNQILNSNGQGVPPAVVRRDIDGNALVNFNDVNLALNRNGTGAPAKPAGH